MTTKDLLGFNKADEKEIEENRHNPGPAKDILGFNKPTAEELEEDDEK